MTKKPLKRSGDSIELHKIIGDIRNGQIEYARPVSPQDLKKRSSCGCISRKGGLNAGCARADSLTSRAINKVECVRDLVCGAIM